jgi:NADH:ubiquinone oxidoreductase subunit 5 (subunit L)/multisubunit Na+/H+ antiporter MnhA subunit
LGEAQSHHTHESPRLMVWPLLALALGSITVGWLRPLFHMGMQPAMVEPKGNYQDSTIGWSIAAISVVVALAGLWFARFEVPSGLAGLFRNGWYIDAIYDRVFVRGLGLSGGRILSSIDNGVVDGGVNGTSWLTRATSDLLLLWDRWAVDGAVRAISFLVGLASYPTRLAQTGRVQTYALIVAIAFFAMMSFYWSQA